ncbi:MAG: DUF2806 domain-containing protein [Rhodospirillaceae bacterium]|nr:DUF2806 domain-containing protein [Rhodospirillaceae bacterium]
MRRRSSSARHSAPAHGQLLPPGAGSRETDERGRAGCGAVRRLALSGRAAVEGDAGPAAERYDRRKRCVTNPAAVDEEGRRLTMVDVNLKVPALEKLVDYAASGIGAVAGSMLAPWKARKEAEARLIEARADADSLKLIADAQAEARNSLAASARARREVLEIDRDGIRQRIEFQEGKRQANIASVILEAAAELGEKEVPAQEPDPDWTARFFDGVQDVSSEDMRKIWAKILSGEVEGPGRTSLRTLSILRDMSQRDAKALSALTEYLISDFIFEDWIEPAIVMELNSSFKLLLHTGLAYPNHPRVASMKHLALGDDGEYVEEYCGHVLSVEGPPGASIDPLNLSITALTPSGEELARLCGIEPNVDYLSHFAQFLESRDCRLQLAPIVARESGGTLRFEREALRTIEPRLRRQKGSIR